MDGIRDYYDRIEKRKREAWALCDKAQNHIERGEHSLALALVQQKLNPKYFAQKLGHLNVVEAANKGLKILRELAHDAGNTGD